MSKTRLGMCLGVLACLILAACGQDRAILLKKARAKEDLGNSLLVDGRIEEGLKELLEAEKLAPDDPEIQNSLGLAYRDLRKLDKAIVHFNRALQIKAEYPEALNNLGTVYLLEKNYDKAIELFKRAAETLTYRTPYIAYTNLGYVYHVKGDYQTAIRYYQKAIERFPGYSVAYDNMGLAYERLNKWDDAIEAYKKAAQFAPGAAVPHLHLGKLYLTLDLKKEAAKELLETIRADKNGPYGREAKKLLEGLRLQ